MAAAGDQGQAFATLLTEHVDIYDANRQVNIVCCFIGVGCILQHVGAFATHYVSTNGRDADDGLSIQTAWRTIDRANKARLQPGDSLLFQGGGTFVGSLVLDAVIGNITAPITVASYGKGWATLQSSNANTSGIFIYNSVYIVLQNLSVVGHENEAKAGIDVWNDVAGLGHLNFSMLSISNFSVGISIQSSMPMQGIGIVYCKLYYNANTGLYVGGMHRGDVTDIYVGHVEISGSQGPRGYALYLYHVVQALVERSVAHHNGALGPQAQGFAVQESDAVTLRHCEAYNTLTASHKDGNGFIIDGGCTHCTIEYCYSHNNAGAGYQLTQYNNAGAQFSNNVIRYSIAVNNKFGIGVYGESLGFAIADTSIYGNTLFTDMDSVADVEGSLYFLTAFQNFSCFNNVVTLWQGGAAHVEAWVSTSAATISMAGNAFYSYSSPSYFLLHGVKYDNIKDWRGATGWETFADASTGIIADPDFVSTPSRQTVGIARIDSLAQWLAGWQLQASSPAINAGVNLQAVGIVPPQTDFCGHSLPQGPNYDAGACGHPSNAKQLPVMLLPAANLGHSAAACKNYVMLVVLFVYAMCATVA
jgi:hypothetical protein